MCDKVGKKGGERRIISTLGAIGGVVSFVDAL